MRLTGTTSLRARALACLVVCACGDDPVEEDLPSGAFTSELASDTFDDLGIDDTTDDGVADDPGDDPGDDPTDEASTDDAMADTTTGVVECDPIPDALSHAADIAPIWDASCGIQAGCHNASAPSAGLDLVTDGLTALSEGLHAASGTAYLIPSDPDASYVYLKMRNRQSEVMGDGARMPLAPGTITECELVLIEAWIADGAAP